MSTAPSDAFIHPFPHVWCNPVKSSCTTEMVHQTRNCQFGSHRRIWKCIPELVLTNQGRTRFHVALDSEHSLHLDRCKTTDGPSPTGYNTMWSGRAFVQTLQHFVFINPIELYWKANINSHCSMSCVNFLTHCIYAYYRLDKRTKTADRYSKKLVKQKKVSPVCKGWCVDGTRSSLSLGCPTGFNSSKADATLQEHRHKITASEAQCQHRTPLH
jgi:hypothetical protein